MLCRFGGSRATLTLWPFTMPWNWSTCSSLAALSNLRASFCPWMRCLCLVSALGYRTLWFQHVDVQLQLVLTLALSVNGGACLFLQNSCWLQYCKSNENKPCECLNNSSLPYLLPKRNREGKRKWEKKKKGKGNKRFIPVKKIKRTCKCFVVFSLFNVTYTISSTQQTWLHNEDWDFTKYQWSNFLIKKVYVWFLIPRVLCTSLLIYEQTIFWHHITKDMYNRIKGYYKPLPYGTATTFDFSTLQSSLKYV